MAVEEVCWVQNTFKSNKTWRENKSTKIADTEAAPEFAGNGNRKEAAVPTRHGSELSGLSGPWRTTAAGGHE